MQLENKFTIDAPIDRAWEALNTPETVAPCFPGATLQSYEGDSFTGTVKVKLGPISLTYKGKGTYVSRDDEDHKVVIEANGRDTRGNGTASATVTGTMQADGSDRTSVTMVTDMTITGRPAQFGRGVISDVADKIIGQFSACVASKLAPEAAEAPKPAGEEAKPADAKPADAKPAEAKSAESKPATPASGAAPASAVAGAAAAAGASAAPAPSGAASTAEAGGSTNGSGSTGKGPVLAAAPASDTTTSKPAPASMRSEVDAIDLLDTAGAPVLKRLAPVAGGALLLLIILLIKRSRSRS